MLSRDIDFKHGRARIGENVNWRQFEPDRYLEFQLTTTKQLFADNRAVSVSFWLSSEPPRSGHLGCQFVPTDRDTIIRVGILDTLDSNELFTGDGLTTEAARVVLSEATQILERDNFLGAGILTFDKAYYHPLDYFPLGQGLMTQVTLMLLRPEFEGANPNTIKTAILDLCRDIYKSSSS